MSPLRVRSKHLLIILMLASLLLSFSSTRLTHAAATTIQVEPPVSNVNAGDNFNINITITQVTNLTGWEFKLFYLRALLNCSAMVEGPFLKTGGSTTKVFNITNNYNSTHGRVLAGCALLGMNVSVNGTGTAATLTFKALVGGSSPLDLVDTKLSDEKIPPLPITHAAIDGTVNISGGPGNHDVAATNATSYRKVVGRNFINNITVTLQNQGDFPETFNVTIRANATDIGTKEVALSNGNSVQIIFQWNSSGFPYSNYTLSVYALPVQNETDIDDNTFVDGRLAVSIPGDIKTDGVVNILDSIVLGIAFNSRLGDSNWNPDADINGDGVPNILDAIIIGLHFLEHQ